MSCAASPWPTIAMVAIGILALVVLAVGWLAWVAHQAGKIDEEFPVESPEPDGEELHVGRRVSEPDWDRWQP